MCLASIHAPGAMDFMCTVQLCSMEFSYCMQNLNRADSSQFNSIEFDSISSTTTYCNVYQCHSINHPTYQILSINLPICLSLSIYLPIYPSTNHTHLQCAHTMSSSHYNCCSNNKDKTGLPMHIRTFLLFRLLVATSSGTT